MPDPTDPEGPSDNPRLAKLEALRQAGESPFKLKFERSDRARDVLQRNEGLAPDTETTDHVRVAGRMMTIRRQGKIVFAHIQDDSGRLQLFAEAETLGDHFDRFAELDAGDWVGAWGNVRTTRRGEVSVRVEGFELLSKCTRPLPEKWHGLKDVELRYRQRYLDLLTNPRAREIAQARIAAVAAIRGWLLARGFVEVETPMLQPVPGGALAKPFVTRHEALGVDLYLRIAPELYLKRLVIGGIEKVFELNRNFRNEGIGTKYNPEFTMLEVYQALGDYETMAEILEGLVREAAMAARGTLQLEWQGQPIDLAAPFRRARLIDLVAEADVDVEGDLKAECDRLDVAYDPGWSWGKLLLELYEKRVEHHLIQPTFVMDFPREVSPLARTHRSDPRFTEHLDLTIAGMEIAPAYSELIDPVEQRERFVQQGVQRGAGDPEAHWLDEDFLGALEYGMPPTGGLGLGIDRLVMVLCDVPSIREVVLFPALRPLAD